MERYTLDAGDAALLVIDIQERLAAAMDKDIRERVLKNTLCLVELAKLKDIPVLVTEQYPKGLGPTLAEIKDALPAYAPVEKLTFDCCGEPAFLDALKGLGRRKVIVAGMETHICVLQTALGLLAEGYVPHVVSDAVCSRREEDRKTGLEFMRGAGAVITATETVLFQALKCAGTEEFKKVSKMVK